MTVTLAMRDVRLTRGHTPVLQGIDLDVSPGEIHVLMGASGAGKSTVLRTIAALQPFDVGRIEVGNVSLGPGPVPSESKLRVLRDTVGMVFQAHALFEHLTARDNVTLALIHARGWTRERADVRAAELLDALGVAARTHAYPRQLSGGEAQRVAIARALAPDPAVLLMDEPTSALDPERRGALGASLRALATTGRGLLIATHDLDFARGCADCISTMAGGRIVTRSTSSGALP